MAICASPCTSGAISTYNGYGGAMRFYAESNGHSSMKARRFGKHGDKNAC